MGRFFCCSVYFNIKIDNETHKIVIGLEIFLLKYIHTHTCTVVYFHSCILIFNHTDKEKRTERINLIQMTVALKVPVRLTRYQTTVQGPIS